MKPTWVPRTSTDLSHQRLLQKQLHKLIQCRRLLGLITAACGDAAEARVEGDEDDSWTLPAQVTIALLLVSLTCVLVRTVERGMQTKHKDVPTSVHYSAGGECYHTSKKCTVLREVPTDATGSRRFCMCCMQRKGR